MIDGAQPASDIGFLIHRPGFYSAYEQRPYGTEAFGVFPLSPPSPFVALPADRLGAMHALESLAAMPENWDGYGALKISKIAIGNAKRAISQLLAHVPLPDITPNPNGTVSLEWENARGLGHIEIGQTRYSMFMKLRDNVVIPIDGAADSITSELGLLIAAHLFPQPTGSISQLHFAR